VQQHGDTFKSPYIAPLSVVKEYSYEGHSTLSDVKPQNKESETEYKIEIATSIQSFNQPGML
jgi:hypothetical protein